MSELRPQQISSLADTAPAAAPRGVSELVGEVVLGEILRDRSLTAVTLKPARRPSGLLSLNDGTSIFVKRHAAMEATQRIRREADIIEMVWAREEFSQCWPLLPRLIRYDAVTRTILTEGFPEFATLREHCGSTPPGDEALLTVIGSQLARFHTASTSDAAQSSGFAALHLRPPIADYDRVTPTDLAHATGREYGKYLAMVQSITVHLRALQQAWEPQCLIHGDFKDDNILVRASAPPTSPPTVKIIDWELGGWGDRWWDVGSLVGQFVLHWITSIRPTQGDDLRAWLRDAAIPFDRVRFAAATFLSAYRRDAGLASEIADSRRAKVVQYAGVFLLHRAQAALEVHGMLTTHAHCCLHIGRTLIADPGLGLRLLFSDRTVEAVAT